MKRNYFKKTLIVTIVVILLGSGLVSGYNILNYNSKSNSEPNCSEKIDYILDEEFPTMPPIDLSGKEIEFININLINTPGEFSWKNIDGRDWTTPAKNQGNCGSCWLFSAMGAFESVINIKEGCAELDPDLSEQYVLSCLPEAGSCSGGNVENCVFYYINSTSPAGNYHNGVITEECFEYQSNYDYIPPCSDKPENWENFLVPILDYGESWTYENIPQLRNTIKSLVFQKGPIMVYFWASKSFIRWGTFHKQSWQYYPDHNENCPNFVNHGITVVGWKDDLSIGNGGYWICKNTWGTNWGYNGFFNIEYDILNLGGFIAWVDYDPNSFNWGPIAPKINGPTSGEPGEEYTYAFTSMDPDGDDDVYYYIDWGDGDTQEWIGPYGSGESLEIKHIWENKANYDIRAKAKDIAGRESNWATLKFNMPRNRAIDNPLLRFVENHPLLYKIFQLFFLTTTNIKVTNQSLFLFLTNFN